MACFFNTAFEMKINTLAYSSLRFVGCLNLNIHLLITAIQYNISSTLLAVCYHWFSPVYCFDFVRLNLSGLLFSGECGSAGFSSGTYESFFR